MPPGGGNYQLTHEQRLPQGARLLIVPFCAILSTLLLSCGGRLSILRALGLNSWALPPGSLLFPLSLLPIPSILLPSLP